MHNEDCKEDCEHIEQEVGLVDEALAKAVSRKLLVFIAATWKQISTNFIFFLCCF